MPRESKTPISTSSIAVAVRSGTSHASVVLRSGSNGQNNVSIDTDKVVDALARAVERLKGARDE